METGSILTASATTHSFDCRGRRRCARPATLLALSWSLVVVVLLFKFGLDGVKQRTIDNAPHFGAAPTTVYPFTSLVGPAYNCPLQQLCHLQSTALSDTALRKEEGEGAPSATFWWPRTIQCTKATRSSLDDRSRAVHSLLCQTVGWLPSL